MSKETSKKYKIIFMGTPEFGAIILEKLVQSSFKPVLVITAPDKPKGRKQIITPPPVKIIAQKCKIPLFQPQKIKDIAYRIAEIGPDLIIVAAFGQILPKNLLEIPKYGCLNVHPSLLPRWRGPSPIQYAILNGDEETGVTIILMDEKIDHGKIISAIHYPIHSKAINKEQLSEILAHKGAKLLYEIIPKWISREIIPQLQDETKVTYSKIIKKEDGRIIWQKSAEEIERQIRAFHLWPGAFCFWDKKRLKVLKAEVLEQTKNGPFGPLGKTFLGSNDKIAVQTGKDYLIITELQLEGKKPASSKDFLRGHQDFIGTILK